MKRDEGVNPTIPMFPDRLPEPGLREVVIIILVAVITYATLTVTLR